MSECKAPERQTLNRLIFFNSEGDRLDESMTFNRKTGALYFGSTFSRAEAVAIYEFLGDCLKETPATIEASPPGGEK